MGWFPTPGCFWGGAESQWGSVATTVYRFPTFAGQKYPLFRLPPPQKWKENLTLKKNKQFLNNNNNNKELQGKSLWGLFCD